jgi:hypothetical protein
MNTANLLLLKKTRVLLPLIQDYIEGKMETLTINNLRTTKYKEKNKIINNTIKIQRDTDILYGMTLILETKEIIDYIEFIINSEIICKIYPIECDEYENTLIINFDKIFLNYNFLPLIILNCDIEFHIVSKDNINLSDIIQCYLTKGFLCDDDRITIANLEHKIIFIDNYMYKGKMNGSSINIFTDKYGGNYMSYSDIIALDNYSYVKQVRLKFNEAIDFSKIDILSDACQITTIFRSELKKVSDREYIMDNFFYKLFMLNTIILRFDTIINTEVNLVISKYNCLHMSNKRCGKVYITDPKEVEFRDI